MSKKNKKKTKTTEEKEKDEEAETQKKAEDQYLSKGAAYFSIVLQIHALCVGVTVQDIISSFDTELAKMRDLKALLACIEKNEEEKKTTATMIDRSS